MITDRCSDLRTRSAWRVSCCCCYRWCPDSARFGAQRIHVGPYSFRPAEAAKVLLAIAFASTIEKRDVLALAGYRILGIDLPRARDLGPILVMWLISLAILVGSAIWVLPLFFGLFVMMLAACYWSGLVGWAVLGTLLFAAGAYFGYLNFSHVRARVGAWLDPFGQLRPLLSGDQCAVRHTCACSAPALGLAGRARHRWPVATS